MKPLSISFLAGTLFLVAAGPLVAGSETKDYNCACDDANNVECSCDFSYDFGWNEVRSYLGYCDNKPQKSFTTSGLKSGTDCSFKSNWSTSDYLWVLCDRAWQTSNDTVNYTLTCLTGPMAAQVGPNASSGSSCPVTLEHCDTGGQLSTKTISGVSSGNWIGGPMTNGGGCTPKDTVRVSIDKGCRDSVEITEVVWGWEPDSPGVLSNFSGNGSDGGSTFWLRDPIANPGVGGVGECLKHQISKSGSDDCVMVSQ